LGGEEFGGNVEEGSPMFAEDRNFSEGQAISVMTELEKDQSTSARLAASGAIRKITSSETKP
jgi:hypothetical protein